MKLAVVIAGLAAGGAARVATSLANHWADSGGKITFITYDDGSKPPFFRLHPAIDIVAMDMAQPYAGLISAVWRNLRRIARLRTALAGAKPECVIAVGETNGVRTILACQGLDLPVIVSEHTDASDVLSQKHGILWGVLRSLLYPLAAAVVAPNDRMKRQFRRRIQELVTVIPNPLPPDLPETFQQIDTALTLPANTIASMGRLVRQKRFDLLLAAFAMVAAHRDCHLIIVGDGPRRSELENLRDRLGLSSRVTMPGALRDPWPLLRQAKLFAVSSEVESFGIALCEAMACGLPVVSFDCPTGPRDIIRDGIDGLLVPPLDVRALAGAMERLLDDEAEAARLSARAVEVRQTFGLERVAAQWDDALNRALGIASKTPGLETAYGDEPRAG
ncbi:MAG: glycosyltransferase family 4 protein [Deltaproteobacteria bacterium]|nr:glycosyltransferase family 4 protein [Deltaproteobacteria bacterium]